MEGDGRYRHERCTRESTVLVGTRYTASVSELRYTEMCLQTDTCARPITFPCCTTASDASLIRPIALLLVS